MSLARKTRPIKRHCFRRGKLLPCSVECENKPVSFFMKGIKCPPFMQDFFHQFEWSALHRLECVNAFFPRIGYAFVSHKPNILGFDQQSLCLGNSFSKY